MYSAYKMCTTLKTLAALSSMSAACAVLSIAAPSTAAQPPAPNPKTKPQLHQNLAPQPLIADYADDDESEEGIAKLPNIPGDHETHRRNLIQEAWRVKKSESKNKEQQFGQIYELLLAADQLRSSTFTRCNLGLIAHELGRSTEAAGHFQRELKKRFPHDGREMTKLVRDVCEIVGRQAFARVGELSIVAPENSDVWIGTRLMGKAPLMQSLFLKPNEDHRVRVRLPGGEELSETISLGAGQSTTLEFYASKRKNEQDGGLKGSIGPRKEGGLDGAGMMKTPPQPVLKSAALGAGIGFSALGLGMLVGGVGLSLYTNSKLDSTKADGGISCKYAGSLGRGCGPLYENLTIASTLFYVGTGTTLLGAGGLMVYALYPAAPAPSPAFQSFAPRLPMGLGVGGRW